jgi:hypothetical protein
MTTLSCRSVGRLASCLLAATLGVGVVTGAAAAKDTAPFPATTASPKVYVVPMKGQMGTDIDKSIYDEIAKDIRQTRPDILVMELDAADFQFFSWLTADKAAEPGIGLAMIGDYRDLVKMLRDDLAEFPQVMWVHDSVGWASLLALSWPHLYMTPNAKLIGVTEVGQLEKRWQDPHVAAKMVAAWSAIIKGFMEYGGYPLELGDAILLPKHTLSANFTGRSVVWSLDTNGMWIVDSSTEQPTMFSATLAEDSLLSDGIAETLEDLMFLLGYREFEKVGNGEAMFDKYKEDWRRAWDRVEDWARQLQTVDNSDPAKAIGQQRSLLEKIVAAMRQFPAVERKARTMGLPGRTELEIQIEQLREELRGINRGAGGGRRGNFGTGGGGGGRGPGTR